MTTASPTSTMSAMSDKKTATRSDSTHAAVSSKSSKDSGLERAGLLANISHELRTPMDAILGYVELLLETQLNDTQQTFVTSIERTAQGLLDIMDDILNLSRMEAGKLVIHTQPFSVRDTIDSVTQMLAPSAYGKGLDFIRLIDPDVPVNLVGDPLRIRQILVNLVGNAVKFTPHGQVRLRISAHPLDDRRYELVIRVTDTGIGITQADLQELFEPFSRPAAPQNGIGGTGLGLVICKSLCESMGGSIAVHSSPGEGSTFCVRLPLESLEDSFQSTDSSDLLSGHSIAIVCPDTELANWIAHSLGQDGAATRTVPSIGQLANAIRNDQYGNEAVLLVIGNRQIAELDQLARDWRPARGTPVLCLVSTGSGQKLQTIADAFGGEAIPAHSTAVTINRRMATLLQRYGEPQKSVVVKTPESPQLLRGLRLLVAEDNQFGRDYLQLLLSRHGAQVDVCSDGNAACRMIKAQTYDLVLMDVRMPQCDGVSAMRQLAKDWDGNPPIIGLTAAPEECCRALDSGMTDCLLKPVRPAVLLRYIINHQGTAKTQAPRRLSFIDDEMQRELNVELPQRIAELRNAISHGDMHVALDAAHKINGTAALCAFEVMQVTAASIEGLIRQQQLDGIERLTGDLKREIDRVLAALATS